MYKAIIQLTSENKKVHLSTIRQVNNLLDYFNGEVEVRIICHGASTPFCLAEDNPFQDEINTLILRRVSIAACQRMLVSNGKTGSDVIAGLEIIPSGIAELVIKQQEGWSYIKAGF